MRNLEREIGKACRKIATQIAEGKIERLEVTPEALPELIGKRLFLGPEEVAERTQLPGVAAGLAWTPYGGDVLFIEATAMPGGRDFKLTGSLGEVMKESAQAALSYVRSVSKELGIRSDYWTTHDLHLHIPSGSQPKDGPSAGITMASALASLASGRPVRSDVAMTGEITLRGKVLPIGGVKEKVLAAHRAELKTIILPKRNEVDLDEVPEEIKKEIEFVFVDSVGEVLDTALEARSRKRSRAKGGANSGSPGHARRSVRAKRSSRHAKTTDRRR